MVASFEYVLKAHVADEEKRIVKGIATTSSTDRDEEIVDTSSVAKAFSNYLSSNPVVLLYHDFKRPVGRTVEGKPGPESLEVTIEVAKGTKDAEEAWELIKQGILRGLSIRGIPGRKRTVQKGGKSIKVVEVKDLLEISFVSVPANRESLITVVSKSINEEMKMEKSNMNCDTCGTPLSCPKCTSQKSFDDGKLKDIEEKLTQVMKALEMDEETRRQKELSEAISKAAEEKVKSLLKSKEYIAALQKAFEGVPAKEEEKKEQEDSEETLKGIPDASLEDVMKVWSE